MNQPVRPLELVVKQRTRLSFVGNETMVLHVEENHFSLFISSGRFLFYWMTFTDVVFYLHWTLHLTFPLAAVSMEQDLYTAEIAQIIPPSSQWQEGLLCHLSQHGGDSRRPVVTPGELGRAREGLSTLSCTTLGSFMRCTLSFMLPWPKPNATPLGHGVSVRPVPTGCCSDYPGAQWSPGPNLEDPPGHQKLSF